MLGPGRGKDLSSVLKDFARRGDALSALSALTALCKESSQARPSLLEEHGETIAALEAIGDFDTAKELLSEIDGDLATRKDRLTVYQPIMRERLARGIHPTQVAHESSRLKVNLSASMLCFYFKAHAMLGDFSYTDKFLKKYKSLPIDDGLTALLKSCVDRSDIHRAKEAYLRLRRHNPATEELYMAALIQAEHLQEAKNFLVQERNFLPTLSTFAILANALAKSGDHEGVDQLAATMKTLNIRPSLSMLAGISSTLSHGREHLERFAAMCNAEDVLVQFRIRALTRQGNLTTVVKAMQARPDVYRGPKEMLPEMIRTSIRAGNYAVAERLLRKGNTDLVCSCEELLEETLDVVERRGDVAASISLVGHLLQLKKELLHPERKKTRGDRLQR